MRFEIKRNRMKTSRKKNKFNYEKSNDEVCSCPKQCDFLAQFLCDVANKSVHSTHESRIKQRRSVKQMMDHSSELE